MPPHRQAVSVGRNYRLMQSVKRLLNIVVLTISLCSISCNNDAQNIKEIKQYYDNGQLKATGFMKNGKKNGKSKLYYLNGQLKQEGQWQNDKQEGLWIFYYEDGTILEKVNFKNNEKDGLSEFFYPNGNKQEESHFKRTLTRYSDTLL